MWMSVAHPKKMQIKGPAWGAPASSEVWAVGKGDGSLKRMSSCSLHRHYANQWFRRNKAESSGLPLSITPGLFHLSIFQVACTTHLSSKRKLERYFLFLVPSKSFCLLFRELPLLYYSPCLPPSSLPRCWILTWETVRPPCVTNIDTENNSASAFASFLVPGNLGSQVTNGF